ncbi:MAG: DegV family protein [Bacilli bacterium]|nr:DegV family protein [Bacilli bacterium]
MYQLFFDSDCDVSLEIAKKYNAILISMPYTIKGEEIAPYKDWEVFDYKAFNDALRAGDANPTTMALNVQEYIDYFEPILKEGKDILYVHFSRKMSATFNSCDAAIKELLTKYPERRIQLIDTKGITICSLLSCMRIGELANQGKSIDEILEVSDEIIDHSAAYFFADNLKFFARSGRVSGFSAFMGGMIGVKPLIHISSEGKMVSIDRAIGRKKILEKIMEYVVLKEDHIKDYPIIIAHGDALGLVDEFTKMLKEKFGDDIKYMVIPVNPTAGCHCGPDVLGIGFHAKER